MSGLPRGTGTRVAYRAESGSSSELATSTGRPPGTYAAFLQGGYGEAQRGGWMVRGISRRAMDSTDAGPVTWPSVSIVFLVYNRCAELRESLNRMLSGCDYDPQRIDTIVVDNASMDGSAAMVAREFPQVRLIVRDQNAGVSGWN